MALRNELAMMPRLPAAVVNMIGEYANEWRQVMTHCLRTLNPYTCWGCNRIIGGEVCWGRKTLNKYEVTELQRFDRFYHEHCIPRPWPAPIIGTARMDPQRRSWFMRNHFAGMNYPSDRAVR